jgi:hypothetical protein
MAAEILKQRLAALELCRSDETEIRKVMEALIDGIRAVCDILDNDATLTATNTKSTFDGYITK